MTAALELPVGYAMADEDQKSPTRTARVAVELLEMARIVCAHTKGRGGNPLHLVDYLDSILRPVITRDHAAVIERIVKEQGKKKPNH